MTDTHLSTDGRTLTVRVPMTFKTRGGRKLVISPDGVPSWATPPTRVDNSMVKALARAFRWRGLLVCTRQSKKLPPLRISIRLMLAGSFA